MPDDLPLLVDIDTGWGGAFNIARTIRSMTKFGAAAVHIEDQVSEKRCGHRPGKELVRRTRWSIASRPPSTRAPIRQFVIMARTDAIAAKDSTRDRARARLRCGRRRHDLRRGVTELAMYETFKAAVGVPILANITEFGKTPLFTREELGAAGVDIVLYCCSAYRAMNAAALNVYQTIRATGTQKELMPGDAVARRPLRVPRLPRLRSKARRACFHPEVKA
jgi:methylisocitrate lyase